MSLQLITVYYNYTSFKHETYRCVKFNHNSNSSILGVFDHLSNVVLTVNVVLVIGTLVQKKRVTLLIKQF